MQMWWHRETPSEIADTLIRQGWVTLGDSDLAYLRGIVYRAHIPLRDPGIALLRELEQTETAANGGRGAAAPGEVFLCYARKDAKRRDDLLTMLAPALRNEMLDIWYDGKIKPSQNWRGEIEAALHRARVGVLLVSKHFLASDFISNEELPFLIAAAERAKIKLSWVLISEAMHEREEFAKLQALHDIAKPLSALRGHGRDKVLKEIAQKIVNMAS